MNETPPPTETPEKKPEATPLADLFLARAKRLWAGNGAPDKEIDCIEVQEQVYVLNGVVQLSPSLEKKVIAYEGPARGKKTKVFSSPDEMAAEVEAFEKTFLSSREWFEDSVKELEALNGKGWGLEKVIVTLPDKSAFWAATIACPTCNSSCVVPCEQCNNPQGQVFCATCNGTGEETCPLCFGSGRDPQNQERACQLCQGRMRIVCRTCRGLGWTPCLACQGRGNIPCPTCKGQGQLTQDLTLEKTVDVHFRLENTPGLPSGLLRAIDRLGIAQLPKGFAKIEMRRPEIKEDDDKETKESTQNTLLYKASVPYADIKMKFGTDRAVLVSCFGPKATTVGCPPFLEPSTRQAREALARAAENKGPLDVALSKRALKEALSLTLEGKGGDDSVGFKNFKRLYPFGFSTAVIKSILKNMTLALAHKTRQARLGAALLFGLVALGLDAGYFFLGGRSFLLSLGGLKLMQIADALLPFLEGFIAWQGVSFAAGIVLKSHFPDLPKPKKQDAGTIGYALLGFVLAFYFICFFV